MTCGCGQTYYINEDVGNPNGTGRKRDASFQSIMKFLLCLLVVFIVFFCLIFAFNKNGKEEDVGTSGSSQSKGTNNKLTNNPLEAPIKNHFTTQPTKYNKIHQVDHKLMQSSSIGDVSTKTILLFSAESTTDNKGITLQSNDPKITTINSKNNLIYETELTNVDNRETTTAKYSLKNKNFVGKEPNESVNNSLIEGSAPSTNVLLPTLSETDISTIITNRLDTESTTDYTKATLRPTGSEISYTSNERYDQTETVSDQHTESTETLKLSYTSNERYNQTETVSDQHTESTETLKSTDSNKYISYDGYLTIASKNATEQYAENNSSINGEENYEYDTTTISAETNGPEGVALVSDIDFTTVFQKEEEIVEIQTMYIKPSEDKASTMPTLNQNQIDTEIDSGNKETYINNIGEVGRETTHIDTLPTTPTTFTLKTELDHSVTEPSNGSKDNVNNPESYSVKPELDQQNNHLEKTDQACQTATCKRQASQILQKINFNTDPCEDFYQFSCGSDRNTEESMESKQIEVLLEAVYNTKDTSDKPFKSFRTFFESCAKYENENGYSAKIEQVLSNNIPQKSLTDLLSFLLLRQSTPLFEVRTGIVHGKYGLQILPPSDYFEEAGGILEDWSLESHIRRRCSHISDKLKYAKVVDLQAVYEQYKNCKYETFSRMLKDFLSIKLDGKKQPIDVADFDFLLNKEQISGIDIQDSYLNNRYIQTDISELIGDYGEIDWNVLFRRISRDFKESTPIFLFLEEKYLSPLMIDLNRRMKEDQEKVINTIKVYYELQLYEYLMAKKDNVDKFCMKQALHLMPEIANDIFVEKIGTNEIRIEHDKIKIVFKTLIESFNLLIDDSKVTETTKNLFKNRLQKLKLDFKKNVKSTLTQNILYTNDYLSNMFVLLEGSVKKKMLNYRWTPQPQNFPKLVPSTDTIEISNAFIYKYISNDKMSSDVSETYLHFYLARAIAMCLAMQMNKKSKPTSDETDTFLTGLDNYLIDNTWKIWNGQKIYYHTQEDDRTWSKLVESSTLDRIADSLALQVAFKSIFPKNASAKTLPWISEQYDAATQFFILITQDFCKYPTMDELAQNLYESPHMPSHVRVDSMMANSRHFETTFMCPEGSQMNPQPKIQFDTFKPVDYSWYSDL